jgi:hypothetical protein
MPPQAQSLSVTINGQIQTMNFASGNFFSQAAQIASAEGLRRRRKANSIAPWLRVIGLSFGAALAATDSSAEEAFECIQRPVAFDGIAPLSYATVTGAAGSKAYLHAHSPEQCATTSEDPCGASAYVLPGDVVAMAKTCGPWAYVQYIGEKHITTGWTLASHLLTRNPGRISAASSSKVSNDSHTYQFKLTRGVGVPVCEAYLQRLNSSTYPSPPYCGRPEDDSVPGFTRLTRVPLPASQVQFWLPKILMFRVNQVQGELPTGYAPAAVPSVMGTSLLAWTYAQPLDVSNSKQPVDVLIWQGVGVDQVLQGQCGDEILFRDQTVTERALQIAFVPTADGRNIDIEKTRSLFGDPRGGYYDPVATAVGVHKLVSPMFRPLGTSLGIFRYRDLNYLDTFLEPIDGDLQGKRTDQRSLENVLAVVLRRGGQWEESCEYQMTGPSQASSE